MFLAANQPAEEEIDDMDLFFKVPPIFDVSAWLQSFSNSIHSIDSTHDVDQALAHRLLVLRKWEIKKLNATLNSSFNQQGLLTKSSIIRIMYWYQKILEQMLFIFKKRMSKHMQTSNHNDDTIMKELESFFLNLNDLTKKCQIRINSCVSSNIPDHIKQFQPLNQEQKMILIDYLFQSFFISFKGSINYKNIAEKLNIDQNRVESFIFVKRAEIKKYLSGEGSLPQWIIQKYSNQINDLKQQMATKKSKNKT